MKTVFLLGAGFSIEAGAPPQARLMEEIFVCYEKYNSEFDKTKLSVF